MKIEIPGESKSNNVFLRSHWSKRIQDKKNWLSWVAFLVGQAGWDRWKKFKYISIKSYRKRTLDQDNLVGGLKQLVDSFVQLGLIENDSLKSVHIEYAQFLCRKEKPRIIVEFSDTPLSTSEDKPLAPVLLQYSPDHGFQFVHLEQPTDRRTEHKGKRCKASRI